MTTAPELTFSSIVAQAYSDGYAIHGDLNLQPEKFENHLYLVTEKHLGPNARPETRLSFLRALNTADLYLTVGCAQRSDLAWRRFVEVYRKFIHDVARFFSPNADAARELAADVLADLCMFDRSGRSRIASFDGQQSLRTWLRVLISHRAINRARLKWNTFETLERLADVPDETRVGRTEAAIRSNRYQPILEDCLKIALEGLTNCERLILLMRFDEGLRMVEIARLLDVHPSGITRQLKQIEFKLQKKIISLLAIKHHLRSRGDKRVRARSTGESGILTPGDSQAIRGLQ